MPPMIIQHSDITGKDYIFTGVKGMCYICNNKCHEEAYAHSLCVGIISQTIKKALRDKDVMSGKSIADRLLAGIKPEETNRNVKIGESGYL